MTNTDREENCNKDKEKDNKHQETPIPVILKKFMENEYSPELQLRFAEWLEKNKHQHEVAEYLRKEFDAILLSDTQDEIAEAITQKKLLKLKAAINRTAGEEIFPEVDSPNATGIRTKRIPLSRWMVRVAAVLIPVTILLGTYLLTQTRGLENDTQNSIVEAVPQKDIEVPNGAQKEEILNEGSKVWVNAGSKVIYSEDPKQKLRKAELRGEAYFSVTKDNEKPFVVETEYLSVRVVGTEFNVKAYPDEDKTVVTLDEGKVEVRTKSDRLYVLEPNQQLIFNNKTGEATIVATKQETDASCWKNGQLIFDDLTFEEIVCAMQRHYNVTIETDPSVFTDKKYSVKFINNENISEAMQVIQKMVQGFSYEISGNKIILKKE